MPVLRNKRHEHFATLVAQGITQTQAAQTVGYAPLSCAQQASVTIRLPQVAARVAELKAAITAQVAASTGIDKAWVVEKLVENAAGALQDQPLYDDEQTEIGRTAPSPANRAVANRAYELIGKELGMFVERVEHTGHIDLVERLQAARQRIIDVTPAQLEAPSGS